jgi:hypothetical protein
MPAAIENGSAELQMLIVMSRQASAEQVEEVLERLARVGGSGCVTPGKESTVIGAIGDPEELASLSLEGFSAVQQVLPIRRPYKFVSREASPEPTLRAVHEAGASMLRGGAFKPRTSPYSFKGLGEEALEILAEAREETGLPLVTELMDPRHVEAVLGTTDVVQIGARNMQNYFLLSEVGRCDKPVLLKRGPAASIEELLMARRPTFRSSSTHPMRRVGASWSRPWPARRSPREPTGSWSRRTPCPRRRSATRRSSSRRPTSPRSPGRSSISCH